MGNDKDFLFNLEDFSEKDKEKLRWFLKYARDISWVENADINKIDNNIIHICRGEKSIDILINKENEKATIQSIPPYELSVIVENGKTNIYNNRIDENKDFLFNWESFPEKDKDRFLFFLKYCLDIDWVESAAINKINNIIKITKGKNVIDLKLDENEGIVIIKTGGDQSYTLKAKKENGTFNIYRLSDNKVVKNHLLVGKWYILLFSILFAVFTIIFLTILIQSWPPSIDGLDAQKKLYLLIFPLDFDPETRLLYIITLSGALGGLVHALRSFTKYAGTRTLMWSWLILYLLLPLIGSCLGIIFYLVIRGGFSPQVKPEQISTFGFAALAALAGLFSDPTIRKLKKVAETLLAESDRGENHYKKLNQKTDEE